MLVLTRKAAETIMIGDDVVIKVIRTAKGTVKIGIEAPESVRVMRGELAAVQPAAVVLSKPDFTPGHKQSEQYPHVA